MDEPKQPQAISAMFIRLPFDIKVKAQEAAREKSISLQQYVTNAILEKLKKETPD